MLAAPQGPELLHSLAGLRFARAVRWYAQVGSTNDEARRLAREGAPEGLLVLADRQTAGRGRSGRTWISAPGAGLAMSVLLRPALPAGETSRLSMLAGISICEGIERACGLPSGLKWPNDVLVNGAKAGGILFETALAGDQVDYAVLGIGINVAEAPPPEAVEFPATSLQAEAGRAVGRVPVLRAILEQLEARYDRLLTLEGREQLYDEWQERLLWKGERVVAHTTAAQFEGVAEGADVDGALRVRLDSGEAVRVLAGDVRLRPAGGVQAGEAGA
jgi:BirA family transcriptional regulator, biotin operon repressor / biotin---[acetyl-CoA-carboxylase] ligase